MKIERLACWPNFFFFFLAELLSTQALEKRMWRLRFNQGWDASQYCLPRGGKEVEDDCQEVSNLKAQSV